MAATTPNATSPKISSDIFLDHFMKLDELQRKLLPSFDPSVPPQTEQQASKEYSDSLKTYDLSVRKFQELAKIDRSDAETQKRMDHFKKKLTGVEALLFSLSIANPAFKEYLPKNYWHNTNVPQFLHKEDAASEVTGPTSSSAIPLGSSTLPIFQEQNPRFWGWPSAVLLQGSSSPLPLAQRPIQILNPPSSSMSSSSSMASSSNSSSFYPSIFGLPSHSVPMTNSTMFSHSTAQPCSFFISKFVPEANPLPVDTQLSQISFLLRNRKEQEAWKLVDALPTEAKRGIFEALWQVRGKPMSGDPIAHDNFGEVSFFNKEERCKSTPEQKAAAVETYKNQKKTITATLKMLEDMVRLLSGGDATKYKEIFKKLPREVQNIIQAKHWEICGKPREGHSLYHPNFGRVSFLGEEKRYDVLNATKIQTLTAVTSHSISFDYRPKFDEVANSVQNKINEWAKIDATKSPDSEKNKIKIDNLHELAKEIAPLFIPFEDKSPASDDSFKALGAAYVEKYPFLKGYFLQLIPDLRINEMIEIDPNKPKPSQVYPPDYTNLTPSAKNSYRRIILKEVTEETLHTLRTGYYVNSKGEKITLDLSKAVKSLSTHRKDNFNDNPKTLVNECKVFLNNKDSLTIAQLCVGRGLNPIVLNAASDGLPGGGYKTGAGGQEESLFRRTGLAVALDRTLGVQTKNFYPISQIGIEGATKPEAANSGLYVSNVPVFRGEEAQGYPYLDKPFETAFAVMPAVNFDKTELQKNDVGNLPELVDDKRQLKLPEPYDKLARNKLGTVFDMAEAHGHDALILNAWGSGAFKNPPEHIAEMMIDMIVSNYRASFKEIHICIIDDDNTKQSDNPEGNYAAYEKTIQMKFLPISVNGMTYTIT